jgi:AraC-like DNA-binding protein
MNTAPTNSRANPSRREIVERAERLLRDRTAEQLPIADLSLLVGVSERGLRNAFNAVRGMSPKRFVMQGRLHEVRRALSDPPAGRATVTDIATEYGFFELGRFAGRYKAVFGETPSATLRGHYQAE